MLCVYVKKKSASVSFFEPPKYQYQYTVNLKDPVSVGRYIITSHTTS